MKQIIFLILMMLGFGDVFAQYSGPYDCSEVIFIPDKKIDLSKNILYLYRGCTGDQRDFEYDLGFNVNLYIDYNRGLNGNGPLISYGNGNPTFQMYQPSYVIPGVAGYVYDYFEIKSRCNSSLLVEVYRTVSGHIVYITLFGRNLTF